MKPQFGQCIRDREQPITQKFPGAGTLPGGPVAKILHPQWRRSGSIPGHETRSHVKLRVTTMTQHSQINK